MRPTMQQAQPHNANVTVANKQANLPGQTCPLAATMSKQLNPTLQQAQAHTTSMADDRSKMLWEQFES